MLFWLKRNWLLAVLLIIGFIWLKNYLPSDSDSPPSFSTGTKAESRLNMPSAVNPVSPQADVATRLVIRDSSLSLVVKNVARSVSQIEESAKSFGGYLVNSTLSQPESAATGSITVRVPESKRSEAMDQFKSFAAKVVSENITGNDVTDEYLDLDSRLEVLNTTRTKFENILANAVKIEDVLNVQRELINLQSQIDSIKGQQKFLDQSAKLSKITLFLSTDEISLPYTPDQSWRPAVVFKTAVRSLITNFRDFGNFLIWVAVYLPILGPLFLVGWYLYRRAQIRA